MSIKSMILLILIVLITVISTQNMHNITFAVLIWDFSISLIILLYIILLFGIIIGFSFPQLMKISGRRPAKSSGEGLRDKKSEELTGSEKSLINKRKG